MTDAPRQSTDLYLTVCPLAVDGEMVEALNHAVDLLEKELAAGGDIVKVSRYRVELASMRAQFETALTLADLRVSRGR